MLLTFGIQWFMWRYFRERISAWLGMFDFFVSVSDEFRKRVLQSITKQIMHGLNDIKSAELVSNVSHPQVFNYRTAMNFDETRGNLLRRLLHKELELQVFRMEVMFQGLRQLMSNLSWL